MVPAPGPWVVHRFGAGEAIPSLACSAATGLDEEVPTSATRMSGARSERRTRTAIDFPLPAAELEGSPYRLDPRQSRLWAMPGACCRDRCAAEERGGPPAGSP